MVRAHLQNAYGAWRGKGAPACPEPVTGCRRAAGHWAPLAAGHPSPPTQPLQAPFPRAGAQPPGRLIAAAPGCLRTA